VRPERPVSRIAAAGTTGRDDPRRAVIHESDLRPVLRSRVGPVGHLGPSFTRYCMVGASGYLVNAAVFWVAALALAYPIAFALAFAVAATGNFGLNRRWTFAATRHRPASTQFGRFLAVSLAALGSDLAVLSLLVELASPPEFLSALVAIGFTTPVSFGANRLWTFSHR
jgi:putative flippase GtrA